MNGIRFAPSPTGRFHLGNLRTAWIAHAFAHKLGAPWIVRFEDIDGPRVAKGARELQLEDMARLGLIPDSSPLQSENRALHWNEFERARREGQVYPCFCSRKTIQEELDGWASAPHAEPPVYGGRCRKGMIHPATENPTVAWRWKDELPDGSRDAIVARTARAEPDEASFAPAYHWACAIDDAQGDYEILVRAWDLESAARTQRKILEWYKQRHPSRNAAPQVFHTTLVTRDDGGRLEKRTQGVTLPELLARGWNVERLIGLFRESFDSSLLVHAPGSLGGEVARTISLSQLGVSE